jgi:hypothetical protein
MNYKSWIVIYISVLLVDPKNAILAIFLMYLYFYIFENDNNKLIDDLVDFCKMIKKNKNIDKLKDLMVFMYAAVIYD